MIIDNILLNLIGKIYNNKLIKVKLLDNDNKMEALPS